MNLPRLTGRALIVGLVAAPPPAMGRNPVPIGARGCRGAVTCAPRLRSDLRGTRQARRVLVRHWSSEASVSGAR